MPELVAYFNGEIIPQSECKVHVGDSGFAFGHNITDSTRTFMLKPFKLREHVERFFLSAKSVSIDLGMTPDRLVEITLDVLERNRPVLRPNQDVWLVHDGTGGPMITTIGAWRYGPTTLCVRAAPLDFTAYAHLYRTGVHAVTPVNRAHSVSSLDPKIKHRNRLHMVLAELQVKQVDPEGFSILLDEDGNLSENKGGNFFVVKDGVLRTPTTRTALAGISRQTVLDLAGRLGIPVREEDLQPYDAQTADEAFFTSTSYCAMPATRFNGVTIGEGVPGPIWKEVIAAWSDLVEMDIVAQAEEAAGLRATAGR
jgi:branched-chain amino acid aminotransferase